MDIIYNIDDIIGFEADNPAELKEKIIKYYSVDGFEPEVIVDGNLVTVRVNDSEILAAEMEFDNIIRLCNQGNFGEAKILLSSFLNQHHRYSNAYRVLAQILMEEGDIEGAVDANIEALRCNPRNGWALLLMGRLFSKYKDDIKTAEAYYDKVLKYCPENTAACINIGADMMERDEYKKAIPLFKHVLSINKADVSANYGLAVSFFRLKDYKSAFEAALSGSLNAKITVEDPATLDEMRRLMVLSAKNLVATTNYLKVMLEVKDAVALKHNSEIRIEEDSTLDVSAKLKYGKHYKRNYDLVKYNPKMPYMEHLVIHELTRLDMAAEASKAGNNKVIFLSNDNLSTFRRKYSSGINNLIGQLGYDEAVSFMDQMGQGLLRQLMNCPLNLFVEKRIYDKYPTVRAIQLLSLMSEEMQNLEAIKSGQTNELIPKSIVDASKVMNIVSSMHLEKLYGLRFYQNYMPTEAEYRMANDLYQKYLTYDCSEPGKEYELISYFAEILGIEGCFTIEGEEEFLKNSSKKEECKPAANPSLKSGDRTGERPANKLTDAQKEQQDRFYKNNIDGANSEQTIMMSEYMIEALDYFEGMPKEHIQKIAIEIAMLGINGISPEITSGYRVHSIADKDFSGYEMLAYYYVSWALALPEKLAGLGLPFTKAWEMAKDSWKGRKQ